MTMRLGYRLVAQLDSGREQVRTRKRDRVIGRLQQGDCAPDVLERLAGFPLDRAETCERPVETHARVGIDAVVCAGERVVHDVACALILAVVGQRVAEEGGEADLCRGVLGYSVGHAREAVLEEPYGAIGR